MSSLTIKEKAKLETLLQMSGGYVADFGDSTFGHFFAEEVGVDIHSDIMESMPIPVDLMHGMRGLPSVPLRH